MLPTAGILLNQKIQQSSSGSASLGQVTIPSTNQGGSASCIYSLKKVCCCETIVSKCLLVKGAPMHWVNDISLLN